MPINVCAAKRPGNARYTIDPRPVSKAATYTLPDGIVGLTGAVEKPAPGTLPLRGDLAHIALAERFLAAHYVIPRQRFIGGHDAPMHLVPREDSNIVETLEADSQIEALDYAGRWCWVALGPEGPSGYVLAEALAPDSFEEDEPQDTSDAA